jgi:hypothetical protein
MKLITSTVLFLFVGVAFAQPRTDTGNSAAKFSGSERPTFIIDFGIGTRLLTLPNGTNYSANVAGFHIEGGLGYMFNPIIGIKGDVGFDTFGTEYQGSADTAQAQNLPTNTSSSMFRVSLQAVLSISNWADFGGEAFDLNIHTGCGYSTLWNNDFKEAYPDYDDTKLYRKNDDMANIIFGLTPMYNFNEVISLTADFSYVVLFANQRPADFSTWYKKTTSGYMTASLGMNIRIGM